jgi:hypothetical protein
MCWQHRPLEYERRAHNASCEHAVRQMEAFALSCLLKLSKTGRVMHAADCALFKS